MGIIKIDRDQYNPTYSGDINNKFRSKQLAFSNKNGDIPTCVPLNTYQKNVYLFY